MKRSIWQKFSQLQCLIFKSSDVMLFEWFLSGWRTFNFRVMSVVRNCITSLEPIIDLPCVFGAGFFHLRFQFLLCCQVKTFKISKKKIIIIRKFKILENLLYDVVRQNLNIFIFSIHISHIFQKTGERFFRIWHLSDRDKCGGNISVLLFKH